MSIQSSRLLSYGFYRTVTSSANTTPLSTVQVHKPRTISSHLLSTFGFTIPTMPYKEEIGIYFDASGTMEAFIDISEIFEMKLKFRIGHHQATILDAINMDHDARTTCAR
jgi:hypothetical protein